MRGTAHSDKTDDGDRQLHNCLLYTSSHLYTSVSLVPDFPGRRFRVEAVSGFGKKELKAFLMDMDLSLIHI